MKIQYVSTLKWYYEYYMSSLHGNMNSCFFVDGIVKMLTATIIQKIFETNSSFNTKQGTKGKV